MAIEQTILFTVIPRGIRVNPQTMPVSVIVSPRLTGADRLRAFPDWLGWTGILQQEGLAFVFRCAGHTHAVPINTDILRFDLWEQLFNEETLVRSHKYDDYTGRGIISYSMREALSTIKTIYQEASVSLALPDDPAQVRRQEHGNRDTLRQLTSGLDVHWNGDDARNWRKIVRARNSSEGSAYTRTVAAENLDGEGLIVNDFANQQQRTETFKSVAVPFAVFHHMPTPKLDNLTLDTDNALDFHQALGSLNSYPALQRALGLVFDLELPRDFVKETAPGKTGTLSVQPLGFEWSVHTKTPALETAYAHIDDGTQRIFMTTPHSMDLQAKSPASPSAPTVFGLLGLLADRFGLAQIDVDGAMHKAIMLSETLNNPDPQRNLDAFSQPAPAPHPEVFDPDATLPSLRSGGLSLFADRRALALLDLLKQSKAFNAAVESGGAQPRPFYAEDLVRGYRLDVWDSHSNEWHSLHLRRGVYRIGEQPFETDREEGFIQLAVTQPAKGATPADKDLYIHEAIARWAGWSLSVPRPGKHLSRFADPARAVPPDADAPDADDFLEDQPDTPFKMTVKYHVIPGSLPRMRFGTRYRIRARAVDLAGNSVRLGAQVTDNLSSIFALPRDPEGFAYLRYEPVIAPLVILRDTRAVTDTGSEIHRIVIRTFNDDISRDEDAADTTIADRHLVPPRTSVEMGERLGMFDDASGKLKSDAATWELIATRDEGEFQKTPPVVVAGQETTFPLETGESIDALPHLPDPLSRGVAIRNLPGTPSGTIGKVAADLVLNDHIKYKPLSDPNPRPGSATLISFGTSKGWQQTRGLRLTLGEPQPNQTDLRPRWDSDSRLLTIYLPKGQTKTVPISSYLTADDLKLMGVWQWLREYIERITISNPHQQNLAPGRSVDEIAYVLQRAVEGGHWMLTPPTLITLVHAVQQPIGRPAFTALNVEHEAASAYTKQLQTAPVSGTLDPTELAPMTAWRYFGATDAFLTGALKVHGASTAKVDLLATWDDPVDDLAETKWTNAHHAAHVDELRLTHLDERYLEASGADYRLNGYYDPEHDQIAFVRDGDWTGNSNDSKKVSFNNAAPRHLFNDTKHHRVQYTAVATSRYREYFAQDEGLDFTRTSEPVTVDVPASARPLAATVEYVLPTFGWQRQTATNLKRSVRFGGGLRVYLRRPWFSSGAGELLGVALFDYQNNSLNTATRDKFKPYISQWGMDPIWQTDNLYGVPSMENFPDAVASDVSVTLEEATAATITKSKTERGRINVVGFPVEFDETRGLWYADLTINTNTQTYMPFVRLALVRYQPHALADAKVSRVTLADFAQLTPDRSAMVTSDPHHAKTLRVVVSGVAPRGPRAIVQAAPRPTEVSQHPTKISVRVQQHDTKIHSDLAWRDVSPNVATVTPLADQHASDHPDIMMWSGRVTFAAMPSAGQFRLLIEEHEYISANYTLADGNTIKQAGRLIYAEAFELDDALVSET